jgi:hypothetical protein
VVFANRAALLALAPLFFALLGCSGSHTDCTCSVDEGDQHRTLACGEHGCVGGTTVTCVDKEQSVRGGECVAPPTDTGDMGGVTPPPTPGQDSSCDDLLAFCNASCNEPDSAAADCLTTASSGDPALCAEWSLANSALCSP